MAPNSRPLRTNSRYAALPTVTRGEILRGLRQTLADLLLGHQTIAHYLLEVRVVDGHRLLQDRRNLAAIAGLGRLTVRQRRGIRAIADRGHHLGGAFGLK